MLKLINLHAVLLVWNFPELLKMKVGKHSGHQEIAHKLFESYTSICKLTSGFFLANQIYIECL